MPKTILTLTVHSADTGREGDRYIQFDCDDTDVQYVAMVAFMEAVWPDWQVDPRLVATMSSENGSSQVMWLPAGGCGIDELADACRYCLIAFPDVEVVVVRKDMPAIQGT